MSRRRLTLVLLAALVALAAVPAGAQQFPPATEEAEAKLIAVLTSDDASREARAHACRKLAVVGTEKAVPVLAGLLGDPDLSHMARYALEPMPYASVDEALREALGKVKGRPRVGVIGSLGVRRDGRAVPLLAPLLGSKEADVAHAAARALGSIGTAGAVEALRQALEADPSDARQLALCEGLFRAAERLAGAGRREAALAVYDHLRGLKGVPHQVRTGAIRGAILARGKDGPPLLREYLGAEEWIAFAAACRASHEMPGRDATAALADALGRGSADRQVLVLLALGRRADASALPAVLKAARAGPKAVRLQAVRTVAEINDPAAAEDVAALADDPDGEIAAAARESLAALPGKTVDAVVMTMFRCDDAARRRQAMELMGRRRMTAAVPDLLEAAREADAGLRAAALNQLGDLAGPDRLPALLDLLMKAEDGGVLGAARQAVTAVCGRAADRDACVRQVVARMPKADATRKAALVQVLGSVGGEKALKAVRGAVGDAHKNVHTTAIRTLAGWKTPDALPALLEVATKADNARDRTLALRGYLGWAGRRRGGPPQRERLRMCQNAAGLAKEAGEKKLLLGALGRIRSPQALDMILPYLQDEAVRGEACSAAVSVAQELLKVGGGKKFAARVIEPLQKVAETASGDLAKRARGLLGQARKKAGKS